MFTGIVEEKGSVLARDGAKLRLQASTVLEGSDIGASIAVNGCCLTVVERGADWWVADVSDETYSRTNLGALAVGDPVNLERPMAVGERFGGHIVLGHVDAVGQVVVGVPGLVVRIPRELTVIPHTSAVTTLGHRKPGDTVNIEIDILAKHVERLLEHKE